MPAPKQWQDFFAEVRINMGGRRLKYKPYVYYFAGSGNYVLVYVGDIVVLGPNPQPLFDVIQQKVLLKYTGELVEGATIPFLGRRLRREGDTVKILASDNYIDELLIEFGLQNANYVVTRRTTQQASADAVSTLSPAEASHYR